MPRNLKNFTPMRTVGARVKKAKIVFDPSINNLPKKRSLRSVNTTEIVNNTQTNKTKKGRRPSLKSQNSNHSEEKIKTRKSSPPILEPQVQITNNDTCIVCEKSETKRNKKLIPCKDCNYKIHPGCLKINFQNPNLAEERWRCKNCKTCVVCDETREAGYLLTCCVCVDAYHYNCHTPKLQRSDVNKVKWECYKCSNIMKQTLPNKISLIDEEFKNLEEKKPPVIQIINSTNTTTTKETSNNDVKFAINQKYKISLPSSRSSSSSSSSLLINDNKHKLTELKSLDELQMKDNQQTSSFDDYDDDDDDDETKLSSQSKEIKQEDENEDEDDDESELSNDVSDNESENLFQFFTSDEEIPDISKWSHETMAEYIKKFLPNEAHIFTEQEIDGASCLLLKRSDVLNCFQLKLGPAIRLYSLIIALQTKERDITLGWM